MPCLPVDSATSCSSHSPRPGSDSEIRNVSLSRPAWASALSAAPSHTAAGALAEPLLRLRVRPGDARVCQAPRAPCSSARTSAPHQRRRHDAERRQRAVAPADVRVAREHPPEGVLAGQLLQARAGVGDRHEAGAIFEQRPEVGEQRQRLDRAPRLGGDDEQRALRLDACLQPRGSWPRRSSRARAAQGGPGDGRSSAAAPPAPARSRPCRAARCRRTPSPRSAPRTPPGRRAHRASALRSSASRGGLRSPEGWAGRVGIPILPTAWRPHARPCRPHPH